VPIDSLTCDPSNVRKHSDKNLEAIKASLHAFGQRKPIVVQREGMIVRAGNGTVTAAKALGWDKIAAVVIDDDNATAAQFAIADNRTGELAEWDDETLATMLDGMDEPTRETLAFDEDDVRELLDSLDPSQPEVVEDEVPEVPDDPVTKTGDLIVLGDHRLLCGDCRDPKDMAKLVAGAEVNVAITSPPYASQRKYDEATEFKPIHPDEYVEWFKSVQENVANHLADDGSWFVNIKEHCDDGQRSLYVKDLTLAHVRQWEWLFVDEYAWTHGGTPKAVINRFKNGWEPIFHFARDRGHKFRPDSVTHPTDRAVLGFKADGRHPADQKLQCNKQSMTDMQGLGDGVGADAAGTVGHGYAYPSNVLSLGFNREALGHAAAFPMGLPSFFIKAYTDKADTVFDPFMGSGTTLIAAEQLGRKCYGMEISPAYCDVIVKRWENLTGKKATRGK
jgi:DNA modification methylase